MRNLKRFVVPVVALMLLTFVAGCGEAEPPPTAAPADKKPRGMQIPQSDAKPAEGAPAGGS